MQITETAAQELKRLKDTIRETQPGKVLRLVRHETEGKFDLVLDDQKEGDQEFHYADEKILLVDAEISGALGDVKLSCEETPEGRALVFEGST